MKGIKTKKLSCPKCNEVRMFCTGNICMTINGKDLYELSEEELKSTFFKCNVCGSHLVNTSDDE